MRLNFRWLIGLVAFSCTCLLLLSPFASIVTIAKGADLALLEHILRYVLAPAVSDTFLLLVGVAIVSTIFGAGSAWMTAVYDFPLRRLLIGLLPISLATPSYVLAYIYVDIVEDISIGDYFLSISNLGGAIAVLSLGLYPYIFLTVYYTLQRDSMGLIAAARILGTSGMALFWRFGLALCRPALFAGLALVLIETLNDYGVAEYLGINTMSRAIFDTWTNRAGLAETSVIAIATMIFALLLLELERRNRAHRQYSRARTGHNSTRRRLSGFKGLLTCAIILLLPIITFLVPVIRLGRFMLRDWHSVDWGRYIDVLGNTLGLAGITGIVTLLLSLCLVFGFLGKAGWRGKVIKAISSMSYACPALVLALGSIAMLSGFEMFVAQFTDRISPGISLAFGITLVVALTFRYQAVALENLSSGLAQIPSNLPRAARILGKTNFGVFFLITLPLLRPSIFAAFLALFLDLVKELPATLILRPYDFSTLATEIYSFASREIYEQGALEALTLIIMSACFTLVVTGWYGSKIETTHSVASS